MVTTQRKSAKEGKVTGQSQAIFPQIQASLPDLHSCPAYGRSIDSRESRNKCKKYNETNSSFY